MRRWRKHSFSPGRTEKASFCCWVQERIGEVYIALSYPHSTQQTLPTNSNQVPKMLWQLRSINLHFWLQLCLPLINCFLDLSPICRLTHRPQELPHGGELNISTSRSTSRVLRDVSGIAIQPLVLPHPVVNKSGNVLHQCFRSWVIPMHGVSTLKGVEYQCIDCSLLLTAPQLSIGHC